MKKFITVILAVCFILSLSGCSFLKDVSDMAQNEIPQAKTFKADGLSIDLTTDFLNMDFVDKDYNFIIGATRLFGWHFFVLEVRVIRFK